ncbi:MAG TPA: hypothetical protein VGV67_11395 [Solirubrobacteraceae bacterium]|nr:hypothetical protein [Solirubrobacteraceae bacterium]
MATNTTEMTPGLRTRGVCELTLESADHERLAGFYRTVLDLPLLSEGDVVELWDFFADGDGSREGIGAL